MSQINYGMILFTDIDDVPHTTVVKRCNLSYLGGISLVIREFDNELDGSYTNAFEMCS